MLLFVEGERRGSEYSRVKPAPSLISSLGIPAEKNWTALYQATLTQKSHSERLTIYDKKRGEKSYKDTPKKSANLTSLITRIYSNKRSIWDEKVNNDRPSTKQH